MKFRKSISIITSLFVGLLLLACEKDEDQVTLLGGVDPVLTVSSSNTMVLAKAQENYTSLQFQWTNPTFEFSNGVNTQDVFYTLQIDTAGSNFSNPKAVQVAYPRELATTFKVRELNTTLSGLELKDFIPHNFEFRIKATLGNSPVVVYSNVVGITITTYLDVVYPVPDKLYIVGDATPTGWTNNADGTGPNANQTFTKVNAYTFVINSLPLTANQFLFIPVAGDWTNKYAFDAPSSTNNTMGDIFKPNVASNFQAPASGNYKITVNFKTGKYSLEKL